MHGITKPLDNRRWQHPARLDAGEGPGACGTANPVAAASLNAYLVQRRCAGGYGGRQTSMRLPPAAPFRPPHGPRGCLLPSRPAPVAFPFGQMPARSPPAAKPVPAGPTPVAPRSAAGPPARKTPHYAELGFGATGPHWLGHIVIATHAQYVQQQGNTCVNTNGNTCVNTKEP